MKYFVFCTVYENKLEYFIAVNVFKDKYADNYDLYIVHDETDIVDSNCDFRQYAEYNEEDQDRNWEFISGNAGITIETNSNPKNKLVEIIFSKIFETRYIERV